jgi:succinate dehydrogenase/fumarate reductase flavoprotein subunit
VDLDRLSARDPHELMRALEVHAIRDCAEMAARASLYRTESRWGLYHNRVDYPERDDQDWLVHVQLKKIDGEMVCFKRPLEPYLIGLDEQEKTAYQKMRVHKNTDAKMKKEADIASI